MLRLVIGALRRRGAQSLAVFALAALLVAVAAAGPLFDAGAAERTTAADLADAPAGQRLLSVHRPAATGEDPAAALADFRAAAERVLPPPTGPVTLGLVQTLAATVDGFGRLVPVAYRDGACDHMRLDGACPRAPGEAAVSRGAAASLGVKAGDELRLTAQRSGGGPAVTLRVTGVYDRDDPGGQWWADPMFSPGRIVAGDETVDPVFVPIGAFTGILGAPAAVYAVEAPRALLTAGLDATGYALKAAGFDYAGPPQQLLERIAADRTATRRGVLAGWVQALVLCALALGIVGRYTAQDRRPDYALLKLRGAARARIFRLTVAQHLLPMLAALPVGAGLGWAAARLAAGAAAPATAYPAAAVTAAVAVTAGLALLVLADLPLLRAGVAELLRRAPAPGRRGAALFDLLLVLGAAAALFQLRAQAPAAVPSGLGLVAPVLLAFAAAVLLARLVTALAGRAGRAALRAGRLRVALAALQYHRRPGIDRIFAVVTVAVALLGLAGQDLLAGRDARAERTAEELGAAQVLTVRAAGQSALLSAVRSADPTGRAAMAVAVDDTAAPPILAVDAARLVAVSGGTTAALSDALNAARAALPAPPEPLPAVGGTGLVATVVNHAPAPLWLEVQLAHAGTGALVSARLGPIAPGEHDAAAPLAGCAAAPGCRLVGLTLTGPPGTGGAKPEAPPAGAELVIRGLRQSGPDATVLDGARLGDPRSWRAALSGAALVVAPRRQALTLRVPQPPPSDDEEGTTTVVKPDTHAYVVDSPLPIPAVLAGDAPRAWSSDEPSTTMFGTHGVPLRPAPAPAALPALGRTGLLVDLDAVRNAVPGATVPGTLQVWVAAGVSPAAARALVQRLAAAGVDVLGTETAAEHTARLAEQGPAFAARFRLLSAAAGLLLAAVAAGVAVGVERRVRAAEQRAMRAQGLPARTAVGAAAGGQAALLVFGALGGVLVAVLAGRLAGGPVAAFVDDWRPAAPPPALHPAALALAALLSLAILAAASAGALRTGDAKGYQR
ncbi:FtsX-like permease family protein [Dactylosporangium sp. CA-139066]|uniref:FtsX-like permease family protein n=1 Tax=Dactylosporangium sp. CA-139066 TaxID=3239930 RepID=UPI003D8F45B1